jgi:hypothetical protein
MDREEKIALKAACVQAAATLLAPLLSAANEPRGSNRAPAADTGSCARYARDLFGKLTGERWED